ncbi:aminopeptidase N [Streptantibioticus silvisoli]|uniref:Aminopeptidase N n=1 Tax=Streptantibioticus silvisoli TaxID=2705255 RepID=A0ABT6VZL4_9ACTN|nr:aminopeptidase N [Streptantibioticus silvisoli]MDI5963182.1 aminopeptidase N [Streptantibioticus silvisoli]
MPPLTRTEAETRARLLTVHRYAVDLDLTRGDEAFGSVTRISFSAEPGTDSFVQVKPTTLRRAVLNGRDLDPAALDGNVLPLTGLAADNELLVEADMAFSRTGEGLHRFTDPADGETYVYSQGFLEDAQRVYACFDQPDLKAVFDLAVTAPPAWTVLGNAVPTRTGRDGDGRWTFATTPPISTYLFAVAAGPYHSVRTEHAGLPFGLHCRRSLAAHLDADADELFDISRRCFDHYADIFDEPYPFDSYDQAFVPEFNAGAMENPGLVTFRDEFVFRSAVTGTERQTRAMVIAHEMAHMWFGDLVTLRWWDDIWLNESFAEYMGYQVLSELTRDATTGWQAAGPWTSFAVVRKSWGYDADQRPSTHPVAPSADGVADTSGALSNFDGISYAKGASAIRQLVAWLGEKTFLAGVNDHITRHRFGNATLADFTDSLARAATDRDVRGWADAWLRTTGPDTLTVRTGPETDGGYDVTVERDGSRPHLLVIGCYDTDPDRPGTLVPGAPVPLNVPGDATATLTAPRAALLLPNDGDLTYAKVRLDPHSWRTVTTSLSGVPDALSRAVLWNTARDMVRDGDLPPADHIALVARHLPAESDPSVIHGVLTFARTTVAGCYLDPAGQQDALAALSATARALLDRPDADDDVRLAGLRALIDCAPPGPAARELADWLETGTLPGGAPADPELRWRILGRLAVLGAVDEAAVAAELARDPSSTGHESAAHCRAALPTEPAKRAAWRALFDDDALTNNLAIQTASGFWQPEQLDLLAGYAVPWFDAAAATAARRGPAIAQALVRFGFPDHHPTPEVLAAGEACLARADLLPAFRRQLVDKLDDLHRAARVRRTG